MNDKNFEFYNKMGVDPFKELAVKGGFNTFVDLELIYPYLKNSKNILELGAGYGRCIDFFIQKGFSGKIIAVEQSESLMNHLRSKYHTSKNVELLQEDIKELQLKEKTDAALWMWSGLIDFSKDQQFLCLQKTFGMLNEEGKVFIDIPRIGFPTIGHHKDAKNLSYETPFGTLNCYIPDEQDMKEVQKEIGYQELKILSYKTVTDKERTIYMLVK